MKQGGKHSPDKHNAVVLAGFGEFSIFAEEAVTRVNSSGPRVQCSLDHGRDIEVGGDWGGLGREKHRFVGHAWVKSVSIFLGIDSDGLNVELLASFENADGDLPAVGH